MSSGKWHCSFSIAVAGIFLQNVPKMCVVLFFADVRTTRFKDGNAMDYRTAGAIADTVTSYGRQANIVEKYLVTRCICSATIKFLLFRCGKLLHHDQNG